MGALILVVLCTAVVTSGCADSSAEQAGGPKQAAKAVKTDAVRQESVRRTLEVVGTLAAEDQVTVSSEVDGVVRRVLADLGDRVAAGQPLVELDREKLQYSLDQQRAAHARALTKYGASDAEHLPRSRGHARRQASRRRTGAGQARPSSARPSCTSVNSSRSRRSTTRTRRCGSRRPPMMPRCRRRRTSGPTSTRRRRP